jgi:diaminopimelate decarboxylase
VGVRFNPGLGSGGTGKTNVGGPDSSFGIWFELLPKVQEIVAKHKLKVVRIHTHIGSGSDAAVWQRVRARAQRCTFSSGQMLLSTSSSFSFRGR